jgi:hypothetical protein
LAGAYYERRKPAGRLKPQALGASLACNLWERSEQLIGSAYGQMN